MLLSLSREGRGGGDDGAAARARRPSGEAAWQVTAVPAVSDPSSPVVEPGVLVSGLVFPPELSDPGPGVPELVARLSMDGRFVALLCVSRPLLVI